MTRDRILITGASGFIGGHLAQTLTRAGHEVVGTATRPSDARRDFPLYPIDVRDAGAVVQLFSIYRFRCVYHLAAAGVQAGAGHENEIVQVNATGSWNLGRAALTHGVERFIYAGSGFEYEPRTTPTPESAPLEATNLYAAAKTAGWVLLDYLRREESLPLVTVRPFSVYGPAESANKLIPYVLTHALRKEPMRLTAGTQVRDYLFIDDLIQALRLVDSETAIGKVFNMGAGPEHAGPVRDLISTILQLTGAPASLCEFGSAARARRDPPYMVADTARAQRELGWRARVSLEEGLQATLEWFAEHAAAESTR